MEIIACGEGGFERQEDGTKQSYEEEVEIIVKIMRRNCNELQIAIEGCKL